MGKATYRKRVPRRKYRNHGGLPQMIVQLSGCSLTMAYKVIDGEAVSARVQEAMVKAQKLLREQAA